MGNIIPGYQIRGNEKITPKKWQAAFYNADTTNIVPVGSVIMYAAASAPSGWLLCNGSAVSRTTYADLFAIIGTTFGAGDGSTTFNLPNCKSNIVTGYNTGDSDFNAIGKTGGSKTTDDPGNHSHTISGSTQGPSDNFTSYDGYHNHSVTDAVAGGSDNTWGSGSLTNKTASNGNHRHELNQHTHGFNNTSSNAGAHTHNTLSPYITLQFIIKT